MRRFFQRGSWWLCHVPGENNGFYPRAKGRYDDDLKDLTAEFGPLEDLRGGTLELTLKELGEICERTQVKAKSYMGLRSYLLKTYEITLKIK